MKMTETLLLKSLRTLATILALAAGSAVASPSSVSELSARTALAITSTQDETRPLAFLRAADTVRVPHEAQADRTVWHIPYFPADNNARGWQGFIRVTSLTDDVGIDVVIRAFDESGRDFGPVTLALDPRETVHLNSADLEDGNAAKGLTGRIGALGQGDWRLELRADFTMERPSMAALAYIRTSDGFVTAMHDVAPAAEEGTNKYRIVTFNPGSNFRQESLLRLVNPGHAEAAVAIRGVDDRGRAAGPVRVELAARASRTVSALALEEGTSGLDGRLGDGGGKWRLEVESSVPLYAMSLLASPTGHLTNLSTAPSPPRSGSSNADDDPASSKPSFAGAQGPGDKAYTEGTPIAAFTLPAASGGDGTLTYGLRPTVPGLRFDLNTRRLSGTPTSAGTYDMTYTATDADGDSDSLLFTITVAKRPGGGTGRDGDCYVGLLVNPSESCAYPGTNDEFTVTADGRGRFLFITSGGAININSGNISFAASHQGGGVWRIDRVGG